MTLSAALFFENRQVMASVLQKKGYKQVEQGFLYILSNDKVIKYLLKNEGKICFNLPFQNILIHFCAMIPDIHH